MKIRVISETQARRSWAKLLDLQLRGYVFLIKRRGRAVASLERPTTTSSRRRDKLN